MMQNSWTPKIVSDDSKHIREGNWNELGMLNLPRHGDICLWARHFIDYWLPWASNDIWYLNASMELTGGYFPWVTSVRSSQHCSASWGLGFAPDQLKTSWQSTTSLCVHLSLYEFGLFKQLTARLNYSMCRLTRPQSSLDTTKCWGNKAVLWAFGCWGAGDNFKRVLKPLHALDICETGSSCSMALWSSVKKEHAPTSISTCVSLQWGT